MSLSLLALVGVLLGQAASQKAARKETAPSSAQGKQAFATTCGGCHGLDGKGGERAPNIADRPSVQRLSNAQMSHIIENGIPGTGMPAFHTLTMPQVRSIVAYLRTLQGAKQTASLPGDPVRGKAVFLGKARCSSCHTVAGEGGFIAEDLSVYARTHGVDEIRGAIIDPVASISGQVHLITATMNDGRKFVGRARNEDNFSLQLQAMDGTFHFLLKSDIQGVESDALPLMPTDYSSRLSSEEQNDVISYLISAAGYASATARKRNEFEDQ